jgi:outer membrane protein OmpA-like peptidoglycan-associated protein
MAAYQPDFKYVAGKLIITQVPPIFASMTPGNGPEAGGTKVTIVGERLGDITSISWGTLTIRKPNFVVNGDGTEITLTAPKGTGQVDVVMRAGAIEIPTSYVYDAPVTPPVNAPFTLNLKLDLVVGTKLAGQEVTISGGGLKANSDYVLELHSTLVIIYKAVTDANGNFSQKIVLPAKSCVEAGQHYFRLVGIKPDGVAADEKAYFQLGEKCVVGQGQAVKTVVKDKVTWTLSGFLFKYRDERLTAEGKKSLDALFKLIKGSKVVKIYGYTETDTKSLKIKKANLILAKARCAEVQKYLRSKGLKVKFFLYGKGGVNPVSLTDQAQNRRVVIEATY